MKFAKPQVQQAALKMAIYGPAGSGKSFTALLIAEGLSKQFGKRVAYVDTEHGTDFYARDVSGRTPHPTAFDFDAIYTRSITDVLAAVRELDLNTYGVVVLDSMTHLWEACILGYTGKKTRTGSIPMHAWGRIKQPYKALMANLLSSHAHVIMCGRQGNEYGDDANGELKTIGYKMKAEGETAYEPHILLRLEERKEMKKPSVYVAHVEKDRTGILAGRTIEWPSFKTIAEPVLPLLGGHQARVMTDAEVAAKDASVFHDDADERSSHEAPPITPRPPEPTPEDASMERFSAACDELGWSSEFAMKWLAEACQKKGWPTAWEALNLIQRATVNSWLAARLAKFRKEPANAG